MSDIGIDVLKEQISKSLDRLRAAMEWNQREFAEHWGISPAALSNYIDTKDGNYKIPSLELLVNLCRLDVFKKKGLDLSVDTLLSPNFDPVEILRNRNGSVIDAKVNVKHSDFLGTYLCYFFDQTKPIHDQDFKATRELRCGVISIYDDYNGSYGEVVIRVYASFYKENELDRALNLKKALDDAFSVDDENTSVSERNERIRDIYVGASGIYSGVVEFSDQHAFINIQSNVINDQALIILYSPHKRIDNEYVGGIGCVTSVAHGRSHMPTAQKMILSKYELNCSNEEIAEYLSMSNAIVSTTNEANALSDICVTLYQKELAVADYLDPSDKKAIITNRMNQLVRNYIEKNVCCVGSVSEEEDKRVYALIKRHMK